MSNIPRGPQSGIPKPSSSSSLTSSQLHTGSRTNLANSRSNLAASNSANQAKQNDHPTATKQSSTASSKSTPPVPSWTELEAKYKQDIEALTESAEMATIEKEIAEEKLDACQREIQELKDKLAEANEMTKRDHEAGQQIGSSDSTVTIFQLQKLEKENELLKQALLKLRDISTNDKKALDDLQIDHEELQIKLLDFEEREQKHLEQIKIYEEQIDVNQSAQEMVEKLTQQKAELEDKLKEISEELDCMDKLRDLNNQILEDARINEVEMSNELDKLKAQYSELNMKKRDMEEYLMDQERTVSKLREENRVLNEQISSLKSQFREGESIEQQKHQIENVAYKLNFSESKMAEKEAEIVRYKRNLIEMEEQMNNLSLITKEQSARIDELKIENDCKTSENSELQRLLKKKLEEISELEIRRDMAEKKLQSLRRDNEAKIISLTKTIETMKGVELQHEEDMKRLMEDNELIEKERRELRDQLNRSNRSLERSMNQTGNLSAISMVTAHDTSLASLGISFQAPIGVQGSPPTNQATNTQVNPMMTELSHSVNIQPISRAQSSTLSTAGPARQLNIPTDIDHESFFLAKIRDFSLAFDTIHKKNIELELELARRQLNENSMFVSNSGCMMSKNNINNYYDIDQVKLLQTEAKSLKRQIRASIINQEICTKSRIVNSVKRTEQFNNLKLALKYQALENEANALMSSSALARLRPNPPPMHSTPVK